MESIPNLNTFRSGRGGPRRRRAGLGGSSDGHGLDPHQLVDHAEPARDRIVRETDNDAGSSRMSAVALGYLHDEYAGIFFPGQDPIKRYPIINRGTYVRTTAVDELVVRFITTRPAERKQIISLGAGSDTRFFRLYDRLKSTQPGGIVYHELDLEANVDRKRTALRSSMALSQKVHDAESDGWRYHLNALDLRDLTKKSPSPIPGMETQCPTLLLSECCLCYLSPEDAGSVIQYFTMHVAAPLALVLYEPIRPFDAFGKTMVSNLASRAIHLQTLKRYSSLDAQRQRLRIAGFTGGQNARDVRQLWETDAWVAQSERERVEGLEWLDEVEEWNLLASHYCVAWGWKGDVFGEAWQGLEGFRTASEDRDAENG
ncbi:S-adenosyl-L-methionine-dependent methyltransferase [Neohortaea acidophila]|uniref:Leucine carboxyl methyltransferase 1 n=1 Tax=Neohortaea acidophila TaxID=245834 RepID=A0A6A6Q6F2_9PEZI|nr:S-adenosyl-L-methionine-dependent methyltransferase [Neohortaea acidophila]KAF2486977.1 S-adenosyl-L-methionine-dependent methyltransferase [Neohortaea acidophila]